MEKNKDILENKVWAFISYFGILFLLPLLLKKNSHYAQYHAKQGMILFIACAILGVAGSVPIIGWFFIMPIGGLVLFIIFIFGIVNSLSGKTQPLPLIGKFAENIKF